MRLYMKLAMYGLLALFGSQALANTDTNAVANNAMAQPNIQTVVKTEEDHITTLSGPEYYVYMRKMNAIQAVLKENNPEASSFYAAMNEAQGSAEAEIPTAESGTVNVRIYDSYKQLIDDTEVTDEVKNMMLSDYGLSINSDFTIVPELDGKIYIDEHLSKVAVERTANAYSSEPQPALVSMNDLFDEYGVEDLVAATPDEKYAKLLKGKSPTGYGFISEAHAGGWFNLDKSKIKTKSKRKSFNLDSLLSMMSGISDNAELRVDGDLRVEGSVYIGLTYKERTYAGIPYKWYYRHVEAEIKFEMEQSEPASLVGEVFWDKGGDLLSAMEIFSLKYSIKGWLGPIPYEIEFKTSGDVGMKYYFWVSGVIQGDIVGNGTYVGRYRCDEDECLLVSENDGLSAGVKNLRGHVQGELSLYPWLQFNGGFRFEALFIDLLTADLEVGVAYKMALWGYAGNDCRIDGSISPQIDTAWLFYSQEMYWGWWGYDVAFGALADKSPLEIAGTPGDGEWREFSAREKGMFGIDSNTYNATRMTKMSGDIQWLDPKVSMPEEAYVGEPLSGELMYRPCLPEGVMQNTVKAFVGYGDGVTVMPYSTGTIPLDRNYPYLTAGDYEIHSYADRIGKVGLRSAGWRVPIKIKEPSFGLGGGLNKSTVPQNSITLN